MNPGRIVVGICGAAMVAGCATSSIPRADTENRFACDEERMMRAEHAARREGAGLYWLNCPIAPATKTSLQPRAENAPHAIL